jgi:hypothetical protein
VWVTLTVFEEKYADEQEFFIEQLALYADMCLGRNYLCIEKARRKLRQAVHTL